MWEVCHPIDVDLLACVYLGWLMSSRGVSYRGGLILATNSSSLPRASS